MLMYNQFAMSNTQIILLDAKPGDRIRILGLGSKDLTRQKLQQYGLFPGDTGEVLRIAPFDGPILLNVNGREIALGKSVAAEILIEEMP